MILCYRIIEQVVKRDLGNCEWYTCTHTPRIPRSRIFLCTTKVSFGTQPVYVNEIPGKYASSTRSSPLLLEEEVNYSHSARESAK